MEATNIILYTPFTDYRKRKLGEIQKQALIELGLEAEIGNYYYTIDGAMYNMPLQYSAPTERVDLPTDLTKDMEYLIQQGKDLEKEEIVVMAHLRKVMNSSVSVADVYSLTEPALLDLMKAYKLPPGKQTLSDEFIEKFKKDNIENYALIKYRLLKNKLEFSDGL